MNFIIYDDGLWQNFFPLTLTKPIAALRFGIYTLAEKWEYLLNSKIGFFTQPYLSKKFTTEITDFNILINSRYLPNDSLLNAIKSLKLNEKLLDNNGEIIAIALNKEETKSFDYNLNYSDKKTIELKDIIESINVITDLFSQLHHAIHFDIQLIKKSRTTNVISTTNTIIGNGTVFIEEGAIVECSILNTTTGDIYIGKHAEVMEGSMIRGPFALGDYSQLKMGSKIYGATSIGPHCKVGGEVNNCNIFGYSNKAHDGFIGNSIIGEWCNLGADTNTSNLKNNYAEVRLWDYKNEKYAKTGMQFCGTIMGDYSKCGINTMFNTGTVIGVSANIFGAGFPRNFIPDFSWGGASGFETYQLKKVYEVAEIVMNRRHLEFTDLDKQILEHVFVASQNFRNWEKSKNEKT